MAGRGGYRAPTNPAPVSGPGAHSQRTDGKQPQMALPDAQYGEGAAFQEIQGGASMAQTMSAPSAGAGGAPMTFTGMGAPSEQPDTPVTDGAAMGAGGGMEALGLPASADQMDASDLKKYLPTLIAIAERDDTTRGTKMWVRSIIANL